MKTNRYVMIEGSQIVYEAGLILKEIVINCSAEDGYSTLYEGKDAISGRKIGRINGESKVSTTILFGDGLRLERGLYIAFGDSTDQIIVIFDPFETALESEEK